MTIESQYFCKILRYAHNDIARKYRLLKRRLFHLRRLIKIFILTVLIVLSFTLYAHCAQYDTIKVGLFYGSTAKNSISVWAENGLSYGYHDGNSHVEAGILYGNDFTFRAVSSTQIIINEVQVYETGGGNLSLVPCSGNIKVNGTSYRGGIILAHASSDLMTVINILPMEHYLYGVVPNEVPSSWNTEALKAQAVCARGFAVSNYNKHSSYGFNVCSTTNCQVYGGASTEKTSTNGAVDATRGQVVMYGDKIIESLFYSSSGGYTANAKNVWGNEIPYLKGVPDPYEPADSPRHSWSATLSLSDIENALSSSGINVGTVLSLDAKNDETGRAYELTVNGTGGSHTLYRGSTNSPFVSYGVLSQKFTLSPIGGSTSAPILYGVSLGVTSKVKSLNAMDSSGSISKTDGSIYVKGSKGTQKHSGESTVGGYTFNGGGWGHGVGLSQYGAMGMADNGYTYDKILLHYYPGTWLGYVYY